MPTSPTHSTPAVNFSDVQRAAKRIAAHAHRTPVLTCQALDALVGANVYFKCENFQKTGAFKFRGAVNAVSQLGADELSRGVVTHSSGNHAAALAAAARIFGTRAFIVMPRNSSSIKMAAVRSYGGVITECDPTLDSRQSVAESVQNSTGSVLIPPFDHRHVIAGQGTAAMEFLQQVPQLDTMIAPVGGGGLMSGTCLAVRGLKPQVLILGGEPAGADDAFLSKQAGKLLPQLSPDTVADGLRTSLGTLTWPIIRDQVDEIITTSDKETIASMKLFWERTKVIIEPSSAVPIAVTLKRYGGEMTETDSNLTHVARPRQIGVIISGGNVDLLNLPWSQ